MKQEGVAVLLLHEDALGDSCLHRPPERAYGIPLASRVEGQMHDPYEAPKLTELGTIEEMTRQDPPIDLEISIVIG